MTNSASAIGAWIQKYNAEVVLLTTQQAATLAEHNARYVNGLGTGQLWSAKDAADLALYNAAEAARIAAVAAYNTAEAARVAAVAAYNTAVAHLAPSGVTSYDIVAANASVVANTYANQGTFTAPKSGYWMLAFTCAMGGRGGAYASSEQGHNRIVAAFGTVDGPNGGVPPDGNTAAGALAVVAVGLLSAGQTAVFQSTFSSGQGANARAVSSGAITIRFIPEYTYPS